MGRDVIVSTGDALQMISLIDARETQRAPLEHAGALCVSDTKVFCACRDVICRLDKRGLTLSGLSAGGPGVSSLLLSKNDERLYALCSEADSVLMISAKTGEPLLVNRAGVNPREMHLGEDALMIAGGESGKVLMLCARSLHMLKAISMPGPVYSVQANAGNTHALCLTSTLSSLLITLGMDGAYAALELSGMPGRLLVKRDRLIAATEGRLYAVSLDGKRILTETRVPGRAAWLADAGSELLLLDGYTQRLFAIRENHQRMIAANICHAALCGA